MLNALISQTHPQWHPILREALAVMDAAYLNKLEQTTWLPGQQSIFKAFSLPLANTQYVLLGESPYPRSESANGFAFWDNAVHDLWSDTGLSKAVNRATSLRNFIKMLLYARGDLRDNFSQAAIASLNKANYIATAEELFQGLVSRGFLLLNASLVYSEGQVNFHARQWRPFLEAVFKKLHQQAAPVHFILLGKIAEQIPECALFPRLMAEHPYNLSFITNPQVVEFFKPFDLLAKS